MIQSVIVYVNSVPRTVPTIVDGGAEEVRRLLGCPPCWAIVDEDDPDGCPLAWRARTEFKGGERFLFTPAPISYA